MSVCCARLMKFLRFKETVVINQANVIVTSPSSSTTARPPEPAKPPPQTPPDIRSSTSPLPAVRKIGIQGQKQNAEQNLDSIKIVKYDKDNRIENLLKTSLKNNDFLRTMLDNERLQQVVDAMHMKIVSAKEYIIREGEMGAHLYVSEDGSFEVTKEGMIVNTIKAGETFGELAILYNTKRFASVQALIQCKVWVLDRSVFQTIMLKTAVEEYEANINFLNNVPEFKGVNPEILNKVSNLLKKEFYSTGSVIVRQGDRGDTFFIIKVGSVLVTKRNHKNAVEENVGSLRKGDFFGELALLKEDCRQASIIAQAPGVECLTLDRNHFIEHLGNIEELKKNYEVSDKHPIESRYSGVLGPDYRYIHLDDLDIITTLGVGGFGRVELAQYRFDKKLTFALKYLKKSDIVLQQQQDHVYNEKIIMFQSKSNFICKLYNTYRDAKYIYFLMEVCLGGDVWTLLQKQRNKCFDEKVSRFMGACVIEAFDYLHSREIIYRDLKPENLLIDEFGYVKLVDFGFAKKLGARGKTYTFAGTPEYVAPEIILNRGHDKAVDYWALGIFIHELLTSKPPFRGNDHMKTYNLIIRGIDNVEFSSKLSKSAIMLIRKLCRSVPSDRLGCQRNGVNDIRDIKWFLGFEWDLLKQRKMSAPIMPTIHSCVDPSNFDPYPKDNDIPPDEDSGWDVDF